MSIRLLLAFAVLIFATSHSAMATGTVTFEAPGYLLDFEVGEQNRPALASVTFSNLEPSPSAVLRPPNLVVITFDVKAKALLVRYRNPGDKTLPPDFELSVHGNQGTLRLPDRLVPGTFSWEM